MTNSKDYLPAFVINRNFLSSGNKYWKYEPNQDPRVKKTYPKLISDGWVGIPDDVDEALQTHGDIYFFKGIRHWTLDDEEREVKVNSNSSEYQHLFCSEVTQCLCLQESRGNIQSRSILTAPDWFGCDTHP